MSKSEKEQEDFSINLIMESIKSLLNSWNQGQGQCQGRGLILKRINLNITEVNIID